MTRERLQEILTLHTESSSASGRTPGQYVPDSYGTNSFFVSPGPLTAGQLRLMLEEGLVDVEAAGDWTLALEFKP